MLEAKFPMTWSAMESTCFCNGTSGREIPYLYLEKKLLSETSSACNDFRYYGLFPIHINFLECFYIRYFRNPYGAPRPSVTPNPTSNKKNSKTLKSSRIPQSKHYFPKSQKYTFSLLGNFGRIWDFEISCWGVTVTGVSKYLNFMQAQWSTYRPKLKKTLRTKFPKILACKLRQRVRTLLWLRGGGGSFTVCHIHYEYAHFVCICICYDMQIVSGNQFHLRSCPSKLQEKGYVASAVKL